MRRPTSSEPQTEILRDNVTGPEILSPKFLFVSKCNLTFLRTLPRISVERARDVHAAKCHRGARKNTRLSRSFPSATWLPQIALRSVDNSFDRLPGLGDRASMRCGAPTRTGEIMAKRKKQSKAPKRKAATVRGKARKAAQAKSVAKAKPKRVSVKKAARKVKQQPVAPAVETVAAEVIEQPVAVTDEASTSPAVWLKRNAQ